MTLAEKLLAAHAGQEEVAPGQFVQVDVDLVLANDITAPLAIQQFEEIGAKAVFDREKVVLVADHFTPNKDIAAAQQCQRMREFARAQRLPYYFDVGRMGIEHVLLPEQGLVLPGQVIVGADSHTCTYGALGAFATGMGSTDVGVAMATGQAWMKVPETFRVIYHGQRQPWVTGKDLILATIARIGVDGANYMALEFAGSAVADLSMDDRFTMANMAIEAGAKTGLFAVDEITLDYVRPRARGSFTVYRGDPNAAVALELEVDVAEVGLQVAFPHLPSNARSVEEVGEVRIDQVVIGSCTNGRLSDLRQAARVLHGRRVHADVRCIVIPGSQEVALAALREGLIEVFLEAGAAVSTPTCGPCLGGHMGILAAGERCLSTTNRNFVGRMGHVQSEVYLAGPAVAAASAILGRIASPEELR